MRLVAGTTKPSKLWLIGTLCVSLGAMIQVYHLKFVNVGQKHCGEL